MKSFVIRCLLFLSIQVAIGYVLISKGLEPADEQNAYLATILDKKDLLTEQSDRPRLILVGGSNVAFGFDTQKMANELGLKPVNFGLHAALGLFLPLNFVQDHVGQGDVVVLSFEYEVIGSTTIDGNRSYIDEVFGYWPTGRKYGYERFDWKRFMDKEALDLIHSYVDRGRRRFKDRDSVQLTKIYQRKYFNEFGDMVGHHGKSSESMPPHGQLNLYPKTLDRSITRMNRFHAECQKKGATVFYTHPPTPDDYFEQWKEPLVELDQTLRDRLTFPVINSPDEVVFATQEFYDSRYHLKKEAALVRSGKVRAGIQRATVQQASVQSGLPASKF